MQPPPTGPVGTAPGFWPQGGFELMDMLFLVNCFLFVATLNSVLHHIGTLAIWWPSQRCGIDHHNLIRSSLPPSLYAFTSVCIFIVRAHVGGPRSRMLLREGLRCMLGQDSILILIRTNCPQCGLLISSRIRSFSAYVS